MMIKNFEKMKVSPKSHKMIFGIYELPSFCSLLAIILLAMLFSVTSYQLPLVFAAFQDPYGSARVAALGGAYTAVADDSSGIFYNPAATTKINRRQINFSYAKLFYGYDNVKISVGEFSYAQPLNWMGTAGIGWLRSNSADLYSEDTVILSYGQNLRKIFGDYETDLSAGVSVKVLTRRFILDERTASDPVLLNNNRVNTAAFDLHLYYVLDLNILPGFSFGLSVKSVNEPNIGFKEKETLPREVVGGFLYQWKNFKIPIDIASRSGKIENHIGTEISFFEDRLNLRAGSDLSQYGGGFGYQHNFSERFSLIFDYAFLWSVELEEKYGSHRATLGLHF